VSAVEGPAAYVDGFVSPRRDHIVELAHDALRAPECEQRCRDLLAGRVVGRIELESDAGGRTIVLACRMDRGGVIAAQIFGHRGVRYRARRLALPPEMFAQVEFGI